MKQHRELVFDKFMILVLLIASSGAGVGAYISQQEGGSEALYSGGNITTELMFVCLYVYFLFRLARHHREAWSLVKREKWVAAFSLWVLASAIWSVSPSLTFDHGMALVGTALTGLYIGMRCEPREQIKLVAICLGVTAIASLAFALIIPNIGIASDGAWQGVFFPKNSLGRMMALGTFVFAFLAKEGRPKRWISLGMAALTAALLLLSRSATSIVVCVLMLALLPCGRLLNLRNRRLLPLLTFSLTLLIPCVAVLAANSETILSILGREDSLTGRIPLWGVLSHEMTSRPVLGFGYEAFWATSEADSIRQTLHWGAPNAHNGFIEIMLGLGFLGGFLVLVGLIKNVMYALHAARSEGRSGESWPLFCLIFMLLYSITESSLLNANFILSILFVANSYWLVRANGEGQVAKAHESRKALAVGSFAPDLAKS